ncbi:hypothetical protein [Caenispirillum salinarum]|uniref:hypothetical protein n=1 Tax=Caenispirillum salinarum TaxID=859058 RepID=UPI00384F0535
MTETWMFIAGLALLLVLLPVAIMGARENRRQARQSRLDQAYSRAQRVRYAGTGEQGRPYSVYTDRVNQL